MKRRQKFSREFKLEAIRLLEEGKKPAADLARELGIRRNQLYKRVGEKKIRGHPLKGTCQQKKQYHK
jgi:transposase